MSTITYNYLQELVDSYEEVERQVRKNEFLTGKQTAVRTEEESRYVRRYFREGDLEVCVVTDRSTCEVYTSDEVRILGADEGADFETTYEALYETLRRMRGLELSELPSVAGILSDAEARYVR
jgi:Asp-tRNA(Asn)/Glu-tRNA(Gln) amidotransferase B subunit